MIRLLLYIVIGIPLLLLLLHTLIRIIRHIYKFPMPEFLAGAIDNPLRHKIQPPDQTPLRHGIEPGMTVLEVGPGNGTYTMATARRLGDKGKLVAIDIEPKMIDRVKHRAEKEGMTNIDAQVADVYDLPFENEYFDVIYMITVISEIPDPVQAMKEFYRVLSPSGTLVFSELLFDPDYPWASTLVRLAEAANFRVKKKIGKIVYYTLIFEKSVPPL